MIENNPSNVSAAFEILLEEVEAEIDFVNRVGAKAFEARDYERAREALTRAGTLIAYRDKVSSLRKEWDELAAEAESREDEETRAERRNLGRLHRGLRTPETEFYKPLLSTLVEMGGAGETSEVLDRIGKKMKSKLKVVDHDPLASEPEMPRWRNTVQWARYSLAKEGLMKSDSPRGVWEISESGREYLKRERSKRQVSLLGDKGYCNCATVQVVSMRTIK